MIMKRILLALVFLSFSIVGALAACGGTSAQLTDAASATRIMALVNDPTGTNCAQVQSSAAAQATVAAGNSLNAVVANTTGGSISVTGYGAALFNVNCSVNCTGGTVINFQASDVVGFQPVGAMPVAGASGMVASVTNQSGAAFFCVPNFGYSNMRANVASYSAGTISVTITPINAASCDVAQIANAITLGGATGTAVPPNAIYNGGDAQSAEPAKATTGNLTGSFYDLVGKQVTSPYANRENFLNCAITLTASTAATTCTGMGAQGASVKIYISDLTCTRSDAGTTSATMTLNDSATTIIDMPNNGGGGGFSRSYNVPLQVAANTAFQVQSGTSLTSVHCSASGYKGY